jgi:hypothetical protein
MIPRLEFLFSASTTLNMLNVTLLDTYRRYKADTDRVIRWLVDNSGYKVKGNVTANILPALAKKVPPEHNAEDILRILDQVIQARTECAAQYQHKVDHQASTKTHEHFIRILKEVRRSLHRSRPMTATYDPHCPNTDARTLNNRFELLELQQPVEWDDHAIETSSKEQMSAEEDGVFAHFCFLLDFHRIRKQVRWTWEQYRDKKISVTVASLTTNVAFDNIAKLHLELVAVFPAYSTYELLEQVLLDNDKPAKNLSTPIQIIPEALPGHEVYNVLSHYLQGYEMSKFRDFHPEDDQYEFMRSTPDSYNTTKLLARNIPDILCFVLAPGREQGPIDELSCTLLEFYQTHKLTVPLVLSCKIFVDISVILLDDIQRAYHELRASALGAETALRKLDVHHKMLEADCSMSITKQTLESIKSFIRVMIHDDAVAKFRAAQIRPARATAPFYMLKHHPTLCGLLRFHLDRTMCYVGLRLCNEWECCMGVLHLYNAVKPQVSSWTDMETLINMYGESHLFQGKAPTKPKEQLRRFMLAAGVSSSSSRYEHRRLQETAGAMFFVKQPLLDIMRKRYSVQDGKRESAMVLQDMENLLKSDHDSPRTTLKIRALRQWKVQKRLDPVDMLALITEGVQQEELQLCFDFMSINRRCIELLRRLRIRLVEDVTDVRWPMHLLENQKLSGTAWFILEKLSYESNVSARYRRIVERLVEETILREGDKETEGAKLRCAGNQ